MRDKPKADFGASHIKGQMDCVDESTNTHGFLLYLANRGLLKFHKVGRKVSRGFFLDGRYPHWTAIVIDQAEQSGLSIPGMPPEADTRHLPL